MENNRFKEGDRVFDIRYGWGLIKEIESLGMECRVYYEDYGFSIWYNKLTSRILSFTEYAFDGYTAFRPEELPKIGQVVWVRRESISEWVIGHFFDKKGDKYLISSHPKPTGWNFYGLEIKTTYPYENEQ